MNFLFLLALAFSLYLSDSRVIGTRARHLSRSLGQQLEVQRDSDSEEAFSFGTNYDADYKGDAFVGKHSSTDGNDDFASWYTRSTGNSIAPSPSPSPTVKNTGSGSASASAGTSSRGTVSVTTTASSGDTGSASDVNRISTLTTLAEQRLREVIETYPAACILTFATAIFLVLIACRKMSAHLFFSRLCCPCLQLHKRDDALLQYVPVLDHGVSSKHSSTAAAAASAHKAGWGMQADAAELGLMAMAGPDACEEPSSGDHDAGGHRTIAGSGSGVQTHHLRRSLPGKRREEAYATTSPRYINHAMLDMITASSSSLEEEAEGSTHRHPHTPSVGDRDRDRNGNRRSHVHNPNAPQGQQEYRGSSNSNGSGSVSTWRDSWDTRQDDELEQGYDMGFAGESSGGAGAGARAGGGSSDRRGGGLEDPPAEGGRGGVPAASVIAISRARARTLDGSDLGSSRRS
jgi:hypothetical protein